MPTIVSQMEVAEKELLAYESRLDTLERKLRICDLTDEQTKSLQAEENELQKKVKKKKDDLSTLRKENGKTTVVSFVILGLVAFIYYALWAS